MKTWQYGTCGVWLAILVGACAAIRPARDVSWETAPRPDQDGGRTASGDPSDGRDRTSHGFVLESALRAWRVHHGRPVMRLELGNGTSVIDGDRLQVFVRTSQDAYLYLAFCSQHASDPRYAGLKVFPDEGALRVKAYQSTIAPDPAAEIVLDDQPGQEALYLIFSQVELSRSSPELAQVIASARQGAQSGDCGRSLRAVTATSPAQHEASRVWIGSPQVRARRQTSPGAASRTTKRPDAHTEEDPVVEIQRGGDIVWNGASPELAADPDGIVVLRYGLTHVAAP